MGPRKHCRIALLGLLLGACATARVPSAPLDLDDGYVWLEPLRIYDGPEVWFPDELEAVEDEIGDVLRRKLGYRLIAPAAVRRLRANVRGGYLPGRRARCEDPPPPSLLTGAMYRGAHYAESVVTCIEAGGCTLTVSVHRPDPVERGASEHVGELTMPLPPGTGPKTWRGMIQQGLLQQVPVPKPPGGLGIGGLAMGGRAPGVYLSVRDVHQSRGWTGKLTHETFEPIREHLHECGERTHRVWRDWWGIDFLIEVDAKGKLTRCEPDMPDHLPPPSFGCRCELMRTLSFGPGPAGRRASFDIMTTRVRAGKRAPPGTLYRAAYVKAPKSEDPAVTLGGNSFARAALRECLADVETPFGEHTSPIRIDVDGNGRWRAHHVDWAPGVPAEVRTCLESRLPRASFTCPLGGPTRITGALVVHVVTYASLRERNGQN